MLQDNKIRVFLIQREIESRKYSKHPKNNEGIPFSSKKNH